MIGHDDNMIGHLRVRHRVADGTKGGLAFPTIAIARAVGRGGGDKSHINDAFPPRQGRRASAVTSENDLAFKQSL